MFFRLLTEESRKAYWCTTNGFTDVPEGFCANNAISVTANAGISSGYPDGTFRGEKTITRGEFAAIAAKFSDKASDSVRFSDISDHWAADAIGKVAAEGWIKGYADGTFRPDAPITRAEAVTILNAMLGRTGEAGTMTDGMLTWTDNADPNKWYYDALQVARLLFLQYYVYSIFSYMP